MATDHQGPQVALKVPINTTHYCSAANQNEGISNLEHLLLAGEKVHR